MQEKYVKTMNEELELYSEELSSEMNYSLVGPNACWGTLACFGTAGTTFGTGSTGGCAG
ncbi:hypothetical protein [Brevibacillus antibioticus]|uniref:hypothetical protein n=1 Tax=Brevibacillus antibioticus TaxID=2570228 RepID=UPI00138FBEE0|nr:hypothetical protein [Brevibacillus antibioticus]